MTDEPSGADDLPLDRSVHGGQLGLQEQVIRAQVLAQLFGRAPPVRVGRYRVVRQIGAGGMAQVYEAEDPEHQRSVAVKVVRGLAGADERAQARMVREARALARLDHPNVVNVYEIGRSDDGVFIAMELVRGQTLAEWQRAGPRPWRTIARMYRAVADGLAAAHRQGLVHRDFKPDNVLVDEAEQRPKIVDFGLVQGLGTTTEWLDLSAWSFSEAVGPTSGGGKPGAIVGTPWYMSPEQLRGGVIDARSDQYSFCLALHEALFGERPVRPELSFERRYGTSTSHPPPSPMPLPTGGAVPRGLVEALARGLTVDATARFPSMDELAGELGRAARRGPTWPLLVVGATLLTAGVWATVRQHDACPFRGPDVDAVWTSDVQRAVRAGLSSTRVPFAETTWTSIASRVNTQIADARQLAADACDVSHAPAELLVSRARCLQSHIDLLSGRLQRLREPQVWDVIVAVPSVAYLPSSDRCADPMHLLVLPTDPASPIAESPDLDRALLCWSMGLGVDGDCDDLGRAALVTPAALGQPPNEALAMRRAAVALQLGDLEGARSSLAEVDAEAQFGLGEMPPVSVMRTLADSGLAGDLPALERLATDLQLDEESRAAYLRAWSSALSQGNDPQWAQALAGLEEALRLLAGRHGDLDPRTLGIRLQLAAQLRDGGRLDRSAEILAGLGVAASEVYGDGHPFQSLVARVAAEVALLRGDPTRALAEAERCRDSASRVFGPHSRWVARCERLRGVAHLHEGRLDAAEAELLSMAPHSVECAEWQAEEALSSLLVDRGRLEEGLQRTTDWLQTCKGALPVARASFSLLHARMLVEHDRAEARRHLAVAKTDLRDWPRDDSRWQTIEALDLQLRSD